VGEILRFVPCPHQHPYPEERFAPNSTGATIVRCPNRLTTWRRAVGICSLVESRNLQREVRTSRQDLFVGTFSAACVGRRDDPFAAEDWEAGCEAF
jgi:hypothetical protein